MRRRIFLQVSASVVAGRSSLTLGDEVFEVTDDDYMVSLAIIKTFASNLEQVVEVDDDCLKALEPYGGSGRRALIHSLFSDDNDISLLAIICIRQHFWMFEDFLPSFVALLKHSKPFINQYAPGLICLYREKARFAIPQLEECLADKRPWFRAWVASAIAKIAPDRRQQMIAIVEASTDDPSSRYVLADLCSEKPYSGL